MELLGAQREGHFSTENNHFPCIRSRSLPPSWRSFPASRLSPVVPIVFSSAMFLTLLLREKSAGPAKWPCEPNTMRTPSTFGQGLEKMVPRWGFDGRAGAAIGGMVRYRVPGGGDIRWKAIFVCTWFPQRHGAPGALRNAGGRTNRGGPRRPHERRDRSPHAPPLVVGNHRHAHPAYVHVLPPNPSRSLPFPPSGRYTLFSPTVTTAATV